MSNPIYCTLQREKTSEQGTFGTFSAPELGFKCCSMELPDRKNRPMLSRIPAGDYVALWGFSERFKRNTYRLQNTLPRVGILIHPANFAGDKMLGWKSESSGCISLGRFLGLMDNEHGKSQESLLVSRATVQAFEILAEGRPLHIAIKDEPPPDIAGQFCDEP